MSAEIAVVVACMALAAGAGAGVYRFISWVVRTQDDREVSL